MKWKVLTGEEHWYPTVKLHQVKHGLWLKQLFVDDTV